MMTALPAAFGRYLPVERIGAGAFGTVYRAHDPLIGRFVAVKVIRLEVLGEDQKADFRTRFGIEARAGGRCQHPAIVAIFDAGDAQGEPFIVMEYVTGRSLQSILGDSTARQALDATALMAELLDALGYAHQQGIIHRDIKPANIIVTPEQHIKVADFGIARLDGGSMTLAGNMLGTPSFMAPEQALGGAIDPRTDLFSAAAIFFAMLTGRSPFTGRNLTDTLIRLTNETEADLSGLTGPYACFAPVLRQALAKRPERRFGDAASFAAALREAALGLNTSERQRIMTPANPPAVRREVINKAATELAIHIGPLASLHVTNAAQVAANEEAFFTALLKHLPDPREAEAFLRATGQTPNRRANARPSRASGGRVLSADAIEAARAVLATYTGPIATVLISRALADAPAFETLLDRLAGAAESPGHAETLRRQLYMALDAHS